ncbi:hypothetical protein H0E87_003341 [Populus deltoides]|uniref:Wall-associated receptor kinase galacturonan-binding domain-containing protein n=1 Tax=Populus deltoides TaxID=3696 RepID=A0A8T2ZYP2_POPDE|nr:hypothetical protein H0E87_003341 [Populus deltoides]
MARPNCTETCGNISIPFPFGIGTGCYMNDWFSVDCNKTTADSPSRAFLSRINMEVFKISIGSSVVRVNSPIISSGCSGRGANLSFDMTGSPFVFSSLNIFIAMGCNNRALLNRIEPEIVGCTSTCGANNLTSSSTEGVTLYSDAKNSDAMYCYPPVNLTSGRWGLSTVTLYSNSTTCRCKWGYDGNPYLPDGCTDIDECKIPRRNWCSGMTKCVNVPGWYKCELDKAKITFLSKFLSLNSFFLRNL